MALRTNPEIEKVISDLKKEWVEVQIEETQDKLGNIIAAPSCWTSGCGDSCGSWCGVEVVVEKDMKIDELNS